MLPTRAEKSLFKKLTNVHTFLQCAGRPCPIHTPSDHHMRRWTPHWRNDRGILERICPHGIGHPDPDQAEFWREKGQDWQFVHGCDGCCQEHLAPNPYDQLD